MYIFFCWGFIDACKQHQVQMDTFGSTAYKFMLIRMVGIKVLKVKWGHIVCLWNVKLKIPLRTFLEFSAKWSLSWILHCKRTRSISIWEFEFPAEKLRFQWWLLRKISKTWKNMQSRVFFIFWKSWQKNLFDMSLFLFYYRKSGWFGPNFDFDAWLRPNGVLYNIAIGAIFLILIWASFSVHIVGTYFCSTVIFKAKNLKFLDFRYCGWFGPVVFLKAFQQQIKRFW
jgi:hypothetical protein